MRIFTVTVFAATALYASSAIAAGIDCSTLNKWKKVDNYEVNQHHIFCGEINRKGRAVGFHSMSGGEKPTTVLSYEGTCSVSGIYTLRKIKLDIHGEKATKTISTMFPNTCSMEQVNNSVVYSVKHSTDKCSSPAWANCGPSAPSDGDVSSYCTEKNGKAFTIASAPGKDNHSINTGFPVQ
ncbi:MAG: EndoU domain-containing protein [Candidatus Electrothrix sp. YB6]